MSWTVVVIACFAVTQAAAFAMLITSELLTEIFRPAKPTPAVVDSHKQLRDADSSKWVEDHEFWEMTTLEEVAF